MSIGVLLSIHWFVSGIEDHRSTYDGLFAVKEKLMAFIQTQ